MPVASSRTLMFYLLLVLQLGLLALLLYGAGTVFRGYALYTGIKAGQHGFVGGLHQADPELGYRLVAGASGYQLMSIGDPVPIHIDDFGFRVSSTASQSGEWSERPLLMTFGCSFTFGDAVPAEQTYTSVSGEILGGRAVNAGVSGHGLASMVIHARARVPEVRPRYLVVQFSPWLVRRALTEFAPARGWLAPVPYYVDGADAVEIAPPPFLARADRLDVDYFRSSPAGLLDFIRFSWQVSLPLYLHDDFNLLALRSKQWLGVVPKPASDPYRVIRSAYQEMADIARQNDARLVVLMMSNAEGFNVEQGLFPADALLVNAERALEQQLDDKTLSAYQWRYWQVRGNPPQIIDEHPNALAHRIIAETLANAIRPTLR